MGYDFWVSYADIKKEIDKCVADIVDALYSNGALALDSDVSLRGLDMHAMAMNAEMMGQQKELLRMMYGMLGYNNNSIKEIHTLLLNKLCRYVRKMMLCVLYENATIDVITIKPGIEQIKKLDEVFNKLVKNKKSVRADKFARRIGYDELSYTLGIKINHGSKKATDITVSLYGEWYTVRGMAGALRHISSIAYKYKENYSYRRNVKEHSLFETDIVCGKLKISEGNSGSMECLKQLSDTYLSVLDSYAKRYGYTCYSIFSKITVDGRIVRK